MSHPAPAPVGGPFLNRWTRPLLVLTVLAFLIVAWRFVVGLGPATGLNDGYPWGLWIALDVVVGTALACGGYAIALIVYVFNKGRYHPLVRPAILASALGYSLAGLAIAIDVGRPWLMWRIPISVGRWNLNSALLEVALCVMAYVLVLWIELAPAFMEKWQEGEPGFLRNLSRRVYPKLDKILLWVIALGLLLPTMHQSSLGAMMMLTGPKLHPLWQTPLLPLLFLVGCVAMGYAMVVFESLLSNSLLGRRIEKRRLADLWKVASWVSVAWVAIRLFDVIWRRQLGAVFALDGLSLLFLGEMALVLAPAILYWRSSNRQSRGALLQSALLFVFGGALYRFSTYLIAFDPGPQWSYFPTTPELVVSVGLIAGEILLYVYIVQRFPILTGHPEPQPAH